jgi:catechol 2,3-dioxygenase-like lactoylglutathione lyase family enzyme
MPGPIRPSSLDHVALWVDERKALASFLCDHLGMHVIEETDTFTLVGVDAKLGKLTLFDAEGPRERGSIEYIALRVGNLDTAVAGLPQAASVHPPEGGIVRFEGPGGVPLALIARGGVEFDLDHLLLRLPDRDAALAELEGMGFEQRDGGLAVSDRELRIVEGEGAEVERPLLNHIALLVDSADEVQRDAEQRGIEIDDIKDAPNTLAVFLRGPSGVRIEYVEHKPGFALV